MKTQESTVPSFNLILSNLEGQLTQIRYATADIETKITLIGGYDTQPVKPTNEEAIPSPPSEQTIFNSLVILERDARETHERLMEVNRRLVSMFGNRN